MTTEFSPYLMRFDEILTECKGSIGLSDLEQIENELHRIQRGADSFENGFIEVIRQLIVKLENARCGLTEEMGILEKIVIRPQAFESELEATVNKSKEIEIKHANFVSIIEKELFPRKSNCFLGTTAYRSDIPKTYKIWKSCIDPIVNLYKEHANDFLGPPSALIEALEKNLDTGVVEFVFNICKLFEAFFFQDFTERISQFKARIIDEILKLDLEISEELLELLWTRYTEIIFKNALEKLQKCLIVNLHDGSPGNNFAEHGKEVVLFVNAAVSFHFMELDRYRKKSLACSQQKIPKKEILNERIKMLYSYLDFVQSIYFKKLDLLSDLLMEAFAILTEGFFQVVGQKAEIACQKKTEELPTLFEEQEQHIENGTKKKQLLNKIKKIDDAIQDCRVLEANL